VKLKLFFKNKIITEIIVKPEQQQRLCVTATHSQSLHRVSYDICATAELLLFNYNKYSIVYIL